MLLTQIDSKVAILGEEHQTLQVLFNDLLYFIAKDNVEISKVIAKVMLEKAVDFGLEDLTNLIQDLGYLNQAFEQIENKNAPAFLSLKNDIPSGFSLPQKNPGVFNAISNLMRVLLGTVKIKPDLEAPSNPFEQTPIYNAINLYSLLQNLVDSRRRILQRNSDIRSGANMSLPRYVASYAKSCVTRSAYYSDQLMQARIKIANDFCANIQESLEQAHKEPLIFNVMMSFYVVKFIEDNKDESKSENRNETFFTANGEGKLQKILREYRFIFLDSLRKQLKLNEQILQPSARELLNKLTKMNDDNNEYRGLKSTEIISSFFNSQQQSLSQSMPAVAVTEFEISEETPFKSQYDSARTITFK